MDKYNKIKTLVSSVVLMSSLALAGCGGGSDSTASINGIYSGSITGGVTGRNGGEKGIIYNNRLMVFSTALNVQQLLESTLTVTDKTFSGLVNFYNNSAPLTGTADMTGSFVAGKSVAASFTNGSISLITDGSIALNYESTIYNKGSSTSTINGSWNGLYSAFGRNLSVTIDGAGSFTAADQVNQDCTFTGTILPADPKINVYNINLTSNGGTTCTSMPAGSYTGLAWTEGSSDETLNFSVSDGTNSRTVVLTRM